MTVDEDIVVKAPSSRTDGYHTHRLRRETQSEVRSEAKDQQALDIQHMALSR